MGIYGNFADMIGPFAQYYYIVKFTNPTPSSSETLHITIIGFSSGLLESVINSIPSDQFTIESALFDEVPDRPSLKDYVEDFTPSILILDLSPLWAHGVNLLHMFRSYYKEVPILVLDNYSDSIFAKQYLANGATGYLQVTHIEEEMEQALAALKSGATYTSQALNKGEQ